MVVDRTTAQNVKNKMQVTNLALRNFRNHIKSNFEFSQNLTVINGANGIGKTNILEALYVLATGRSQRARYDKEMINHESTFCSIVANTLSQEYEYQLEVQILANDLITNLSSKRAKVNKVSKPMQYLIGLFNAVMFSPQDIDLVIGSPGDRRKFIDNVLVQTSKEYRKQLSEYNKAIKQRNRVLEMINEFNQGRDQLDFWTDKILHLGINIQKTRTEFMSFINTQTNNYIQSIDNTSTTLSIIYKKNEMSEERLEKHLQHDIASKTTLVGPHKDDFEMVYNGHNLAHFGSRGQQRTVILTIKLAEVDFFEKEVGERPVLLLDDIFSELDEQHKTTVTQMITKQQTIVTFAESPDFIDLATCKFIQLT
jgi:DNA replication and repair protein RecF